MTRLQQIIQYYHDVDQQDIDAVLALFSDDAIYKRADAAYVGKNAIEHFYRNERMIRGAHTLDRTCDQPEASRVLVTGEFRGRGADEAPRVVRFTDVWEFNATGQVGRRETYLALGQGYVRS